MLGYIAVAAILGAVVYFDRNRLKSQLKAAEAAVVAKVDNIEAALKAKARADIAAVISEVKYAISKGETIAASEIVAKIESAVKAAL